MNLKETVMIRRLKMDVLNELPSKNRKIVDINVDVSVLPELKEKMEKMGSLRNLGTKDILYAKRGLMMVSLLNIDELFFYLLLFIYLFNILNRKSFLIQHK